MKLIADTCNNMNGSQKHYAKWKKSHKRVLTMLFQSYEILAKDKIIETESDSIVVASSKDLGEGDCKKI